MRLGNKFLELSLGWHAISEKVVCTLLIHFPRISFFKACNSIVPHIWWHTCSTDTGVRELEAEDIGPGIYSIEEDKQKTEQENKLKLALQKKEKLKKRVDMIQKDLAELMKENREHEPNERLPLEDFEIDPSLRR